MITATDSFITFLSSALTDDPPVHWVRVTTVDETAHVPKMNACNVTVLNTAQRGSMEDILISLDVLGDDERKAMRWTQRIRDALLSKQYTPEYDYHTTPGTPVALGRMVEWERDDIEFELVGQGARVLQMNATFPICHAR